MNGRARGEDENAGLDKDASGLQSSRRKFRADEFPVVLRLKLPTHDKRICFTYDAGAT